MTQSDKHILVLSSWYPTKTHPYLGNFVVKQIELLAKMYRISVIHCEEDPFIKTIEIKTSNHLGYTEIKARFPRKKMLIQKKLKEKKAFQLALNQLDKIDLIIGNILLPKGWEFILAKRKFNCPLFYIEHGSYFRKNAPSWRKIDFVIKNKVEKLADEVIAVSDFLRKDLMRHFPNHAIKTIGNHTDTELFHLQEKVQSETVSFLHVSTLDRKTKNPEGILAACELLANEGHSFKLKIISDEDYSQLNAKVHQLGLENHVTFGGPLSSEQLVPLYHNSDVFLMFSDYETFSIVMVEAWSTGTPIITTPVGVAENMAPNLGILVEPGNISDLAFAMKEMIEHPMKKSAEIREHALQYSEENILRKWTKLIEDTIG